MPELTECLCGHQRREHGMEQDYECMGEDCLCKGFDPKVEPTQSYTTPYARMANVLIEALAWVHDYGHDWEKMPKWVKRAESLLKKEGVGTFIETKAEKVMTLTERETRMLRVLAERCELMEFNDDDDKEAWPEASIMAFGSELLLAAKEKAAQIAEHRMDHTPTRHYRDIAHVCAEEIRNSDWGDLFEEKA